MPWTKDHPAPLTYGKTAAMYAKRAGKRSHADMMGKLIRIDGNVYSYAALLAASGLDRHDLSDRIHYWRKKGALTLFNLGLEGKI